LNKAAVPLRLVSQLRNAIAQPNAAAVFAVTYKQAMRRRFRNAELSENDGEYIDEEECIAEHVRSPRNDEKVRVEERCCVISARRRELQEVVTRADAAGKQLGVF
jgi:hypothetical protein